MSLSSIMLPASIILALGLGLILFGLQIFFVPERRKIASEMIKATVLMVGGLYLVFFLSQQFSRTNNMSGGLAGLGLPPRSY